MGGNNNNKKLQMQIQRVRGKKRTHAKVQQTNKGSTCIASVARLLYDKARERCSSW